MVKILDYRPDLKIYFEKLNRDWIEKYFVMEPHDFKVFGDPQNEILQKGGDIIFAELDGEIVGTCALVQENGIFELVKLAVSDSAKGKGIGELLTQETIKRARAKGAKSLQLTTNSQLLAAVRLYEKLGFKAIFRGQHPKYNRVDLVMEKLL